MYPINAASPERIAIGAVVLIADGTVQTSGVTVSVTKQGGAETGSAGTIAYSTGGIVFYTPTQAETNATSFILTAYKASCIPVSITVITTASATPGYAGLDWSLMIGKTTSNALTNTTIATTQKVDIETIKTNPVVNAGTVTFPTTATLASTTNITAATGIVLSGVTHTGAVIPTVTTTTTATNITNNHAKYMNGVVWIDTVNGTAGTTAYTNGILSAPVSGVADAKTIADNLKMKKFYFVAGSSITLAANYGGYVFEGPSWTLALGGQAIAAAKFIGATVTGIGTGAASVFEHCSIGTVTLPTTEINYCGVSGTFTVSATGAYSFDECYNESAAGTDWILDFAAVGATSIGLRHFAGSVEVRNMAAGDILVFSGNGKLTLAASCTAGTVNIRGMVELVNNGSGQTITDTSRWNEDQSIASVTGAVGSVTAGVTLSTATMTESYATDGAAMSAPQALHMIWSKMAEMSISGTTMTTKKLDGSTSSMTFTLNDATTPSSITRAT
tara:strand:- start:1639 stop:3147 length:1509 start_codon:yes stop_codon:yes gene_type:complete